MPNTTSNNTVLKGLKVLRQAFLLASLLIIGGVVLSHYVHVYFLALPILVSGGLMFSSIVGWCPMIFILEHMPWNRRDTY